jgi:hypothetical protein
MMTPVIKEKVSELQRTMKGRDWGRGGTRPYHQR